MRVAGASKTTVPLSQHQSLLRIPHNRLRQPVVCGVGPVHSTTSSFFNGGSLRLLTQGRQTRRCNNRGLVRCKAMVNVEVSSPSLLLGVALIMSGVSLFAVRTSNRRISRDSDVIVSSLIIVTGGALVFQGWRLDPLMLLCQIMTCGVACTFAYEAFALREQRPPNDLGMRRRPPVQLPQSKDEFFYDFDDPDLQDPTNSELPESRSAMDEYLDEEEDRNWNVIGGLDPTIEDYTPWDDQPRKKGTNQRSKGSKKSKEVLQSIEDWE